MLVAALDVDEDEDLDQDAHKHEYEFSCSYIYPCLSMWDFWQVREGERIDAAYIDILY